MKERSSWRQIRMSTSPTFISAFFTSSTASGTRRSASRKGGQQATEQSGSLFSPGPGVSGAGKHQQAVDVLQKSIQFTPSLAHNDYQVTTAHYRLGQSLIKVGRTAEGQQHLQKSAELKSKGFKLDEKTGWCFSEWECLPRRMALARTWLRLKELLRTLCPSIRRRRSD